MIGDMKIQRKLGVSLGIVFLAFIVGLYPDLDAVAGRGDDVVNQIAFTVRQDNDEYSLVVIDADGDNRRTVIEGLGSYEWSPDGSLIAFATRPIDGLPQLNVIDADGNNRRTILENVRFGTYMWSPDSNTILYLSRSSSEPNASAYNMYLIDANGDNNRAVVENVPIGRIPAWSPDGRQIMYLSNSDIYIVDVEVQEVRNLTNSELRESHETWSPDSTRVAFVQHADDTKTLMVVDASGENLQTLMETTGIFGEPKWSPDGSQIAIVGGIEWIDVFVMNADGTNQRELLSPKFDQLIYMVWLPSGEELLLNGLFVEPLVGLVLRIDVETGEYQSLELENRLEFEPFRLSPDGSQIMFLKPVSEAIQGPIYVVDIDGENLRQLTDPDEIATRETWRPR